MDQIPVLVTIRAEHTNEENESIVVKVPGFYSILGDSYYIRYEETDYETHDSVKCLIKLQENFMSVTKKGSYRSNMQFRPEEITEVGFATAFGSMVMEVETLSYTLHVYAQDCADGTSTCDLEENSVENETLLQAELRYRLSSSGIHLTECCMMIEIVSTQCE